MIVMSRWIKRNAQAAGGKVLPIILCLIAPIQAWQGTNTDGLSLQDLLGAPVWEVGDRVSPAIDVVHDAQWSLVRNRTTIYASLSVKKVLEVVGGKPTKIALYLMKDRGEWMAAMDAVFAVKNQEDALASRLPFHILEKEAGRWVYVAGPETDTARKNEISLYLLDNYEPLQSQPSHEQRKETVVADVTVLQVDEALQPNRVEVDFQIQQNADTLLAGFDPAAGAPTTYTRVGDCWAPETQRKDPWSAPSLDETLSELFAGAGPFAALLPKTPVYLEQAWHLSPESARALYAKLPFAPAALLPSVDLTCTGKLDDAGNPTMDFSGNAVTRWKLDGPVGMQLEAKLWLSYTFDAVTHQLLRCRKHADLDYQGQGEAGKAQDGPTYFRGLYHDMSGGGYSHTEIHVLPEPAREAEQWADAVIEAGITDDLILDLMPMIADEFKHQHPRGLEMLGSKQRLRTALRQEWRTYFQRGDHRPLIQYLQDPLIVRFHHAVLASGHLLMYDSEATQAFEAQIRKGAYPEAGNLARFLSRGLEPRFADLYFLRMEDYADLLGEPVDPLTSEATRDVFNKMMPTVYTHALAQMDAEGLKALQTLYQHPDLQDFVYTQIAVTASALDRQARKAAETP